MARRLPPAPAPAPRGSTVHGTGLADLARTAVDEWDRSPRSWTDVRERWLTAYGPASLPVLARAFRDARLRLLLSEDAPTSTTRRHL